MFVTNSQRPRRRLGFRRRVAPAASSMIAVLIWSGLVSPASGEDRGTGPRYDRAVLSEIARDVLRRGAAGGNQSVPESTSPMGEAEEELAVAESAPELVPPATHIAPAREGIIVPIPPTSSAPKKVLSKSETTGYQSNSWRQRPETERALSFSSGVLAPSSGLDPALKAHADGLRAQGRQFVYGFLLLRVPPDAALETKLASLGVQLLGPHDDHHKARLPVGSLEAIAKLPEVEWVGVSAPKQKLSLELTERSWLSGEGGRRRPHDADPDRHQSLRRRRERELPAAARSRRGRDRRVRRRAAVLSRGGHRADHRPDRRPRLRAVRRADRADVRRA